MEMVTRLVAAGRHEEAEAYLRADLAKNPGDTRTAYNLAVVLKTLGKTEEAVSLFAAIVKHQPRHFGAIVNLSNLRYDQGDFDGAEALAAKAVRLDPIPEALYNLGRALRAQGRAKDAVKAYNRARASKPSAAFLPWLEWNTANALMQAGDYARGFAAYESRHRVGRSRIGVARTDIPLWDGATLPGRLLVTWEQGLGDTLQFIRYLARARARVGHLTVEVQAPLAALVSSAGLADAVIATGPAEQPAGDFQAQSPLLSLPYLLGDTAPQAMDGSYLRVVEAPPAELREPARRPRIGLVWQGSRTNEIDRYRSIPLAAFRPMMEARPDLEFYSLQVGEGTEQLAALPDGALKQIGADFATTAAAINALDLVVTIDSVTAHLAGALARPVFVLIAKNQDWRWG
ncbi:MAG: tetratricopeptide repeat protein, partial [Magnetospirillum sp.]|nr:tetratricopeptide repeat protein [Magnetospirillum sp.]